ncbi:hypothetical protein RRG08_035276 [Elysia crispata]|uniref:Uncharacterized protein n=1 Tax=Elysia crispata TaxID=231223 RepID=A0AAE1DMY6_9GAST|nr:hypothetical protein RRG08_035276 [Elysia crispata]
MLVLPEAALCFCTSLLPEVLSADRLLPGATVIFGHQGDPTEVSTINSLNRGVHSKTNHAHDQRVVWEEPYSGSEMPQLTEEGFRNGAKDFKMELYRCRRWQISITESSIVGIGDTDSGRARLAGKTMIWNTHCTRGMCQHYLQMQFLLM